MQSAMLMAVMEAIPSPVFFKDMKGIYTGCNKAFGEFAGKKADDIVGKTVYEVFPKEMADIFYNADMELISGKKTEQVYETKVKYPDGASRDIIFRKSVFNGPDGKMAGVVGVMMDVTEQKKIENQLNDILNFKMSIFDASPVGIFVYKETGECIMANKKGAEMIGARAEDILKQNFHLIDSWKRTGLIASAKKVLETEEKMERDIHIETTFGKDVFLAMQFTTFISGGMKHLLLMFSDISERKKDQKIIEERIEEVEKLNKIMLGREDRIIEMKKEVNDLLKELGREPKYGT